VRYKEEPMTELMRVTPNDYEACVAPSQSNALPLPLTEPPYAPSTDEQWLSGRHTQRGRSIGYRLYVPQTEPGAAPLALVVMLHGCHQDAEDFAKGTDMNRLAAECGAMVLYPEQAQRANSQNCWNWFKTQHQRRGRGEPELLVGLIQAVTAEHHVDPARTYVAGLSSGGAMAAILARCYPEIFAAVGVHSGVPAGAARDLGSALEVMRHGAPVDGIAPGTPVPLIVFQGSADDVVHPGNANALVDAACKALGITSAPQVQSGRGINFRSFTRRTYAADGGAQLVEHWQLTGAGHAWSGGHTAGSCTAPGGPSASAEMLRFFLSHRSEQARH
jgi:poly(hydroxyalkanoate) depolymerase family esterase